MRTRRFAFVLFAAAMLFSVVREWSAPVACLRLPVTHVRVVAQSGENLSH
jgi:hypothetical protein